MAGFFDVDLIKRIPQVDKKVRLVGLYKRREREGQKEHERPAREARTGGAGADAGADTSPNDAGEKRTIDITV